MASNVGAGQVLMKWSFPFITHYSQCGISFNMQIPLHGLSFNQTSLSVQAKVGLRAAAGVEKHVPTLVLPDSLEFEPLRGPRPQS